MSIITPSDTALAYLQQFTPGQQRFDLSEQSDPTGHTATRLGGPPRWTVALRTLDALEPAISAMWKAIALQLRGRINHLALYDVTQPQPRGTARGAITLGSSAAAGATTLYLNGCRGLNFVLGGSFETDTNADGLADGWTRYSNGSTGALSAAQSTTAVLHGTYSQQLVAAALGGAVTDRNGIEQAGVPVGALAGQVVTLACRIAGTAATGLMLYAAWFDAGNTPTGGDIFVTGTATGGVQDFTISGTCPANAATATIYVYQNAGSGSSATLLVDGVRLVLGSSSPSYPPLPTLLQGDMLQVGTGVGSHYCMLTADNTASDAGVFAASIEPPLRRAIGSGAVVIWDKPKGHYKQRPDSLSWSGAAGSSMVGGFAFDLMEDWSA